MAIKGELFSQDMAKAFLENRKIRTSRPIKPQPCEESKRFEHWVDGLARFGNNKSSAVCSRNPKYQPGDIMYAREAWSTQYDGIHDNNGYGIYVYKADGTILDNAEGMGVSHWHPSIHMPREAARLFFRVTDVKVQNIADMTEQDAVDDGFEAYGGNSTVTAKNCFEAFWRSQYGDDIQWIWVYYLEKISREEALNNGTGKN